MQTSANKEKTSSMEVLLTLKGGEKLIIDLQPLADFLEDAELETPQGFSQRFQELMDRFVEAMDYNTGRGFDQNQFKNDYEFLRKFRELFKELGWKEVKDES